MTGDIFYLRIGKNLRGHQFRPALNEFALRLREVLAQLHQLNIWTFDMRVIDGEIIKFTFTDGKAATAFKLAFAEHLLSQDDLDNMLELAAGHPSYSSALSPQQQIPPPKSSLPSQPLFGTGMLVVFPVLMAVSGAVCFLIIAAAVMAFLK